MSQHSFVIPNESGALFRADNNNALQALASSSLGATAPATTYAGQFWGDTTAVLLKQRDSTNSSWITVGILNAANLGLLALAGGTVTGNIVMSGAAIELAQGANVASATTTVLDGTTGNIIDITGTNAITGITLGQGKFRIARFTGILTFTNGASLILPGNANITTAAGDQCIIVGYAAGVVRVFFYTRALAVPLASFLQFAGPTALRTYTLPDIAATLAALGVRQVWTLNQVSQSKLAATTSGTLTPDFTTYTDIDYTLNGNITSLANPTTDANSVGQRGTIRPIQDGTGSRLLSAIGTNWKRIGSVTSLPVLSTAAGSNDRIDYHIVATNRIEYAFNAAAA